MENAHEHHELDSMLQEIQQQEGEQFTFDRYRIVSEVDASTSFFSNLPVKLLTILGGILASMFFMAFLLLGGLHKSDVGMLLFGIVFIVGAVVTIRRYNHTLLETACVSFYMIGYLLFGIGLADITDSGIVLCAALSLIALATIVVSDSVVFTFLAVLVLNGSLVALIHIQEVDNLMHGYIGVVAGLLTYLSLQEAKLISGSKKLNLVYRPVRMGLVFSLIGALLLMVHERILVSEITHYWIASGLLIVALLFVIAKVMEGAAVNGFKQKALVYIGCCVVLAPTILTPSVPGALLVIISSYHIGHKTSFVAGLVSLIYFVALYYYDLQMTLLVKSGILVLSGSLFVLAYVLLHKSLKYHVEEK